MKPGCTSTMQPETDAYFRIGRAFTAWTGRLLGSLRAIVESVRHEVACQLLANTRLPLNEIATVALRRAAK